MNMTDILLIIIIVLLIARVALQIWQGTRAVSDEYATATAVRKVVVKAKTADELQQRLCEQWWYSDYELVAIIKDKGEFYAFLESKKVRNYYGE